MSEEEDVKQPPVLAAMTAIGDALRYRTIPVSDETEIFLNDDTVLALMEKDDGGAEYYEGQDIPEGMRWKLSFRTAVPEGKLSSNPAMLAVQLTSVLNQLADMLNKVATDLVEKASAALAAEEP